MLTPAAGLVALRQLWRRPTASRQRQRSAGGNQSLALPCGRVPHSGLGDQLFAARLFWLLCGVVTLQMVAVIARRLGVNAARATLPTLSCYGFVYRNVVARGFALAQLLMLAGVTVLCAARRANRELDVGAGLLLGAATFTNYLAVFIGFDALSWWCAWLRCSSAPLAPIAGERNSAAAAWRP